MKFNFVLMLVLLLPAVTLSAKSAGQVDPAQKHEVRLGLGDMLFETLIWNNQVHKDYSAGLPGSVFNEKRDYAYSPHISGEYTYRILPWLSLGGIVDFQITGWKNHQYDNTNREVNVSNGNFYNLCIMPSVRFNYFRREHVELYSAIAAGMDINGGTETDSFGRHTEVGVAADLRFIGAAFGSGCWWGFIELGGTYALRNKNCMYLMNSEIFKLGVSYKF